MSRTTPSLDMRHHIVKRKWIALTATCLIFCYVTLNLTIVLRKSNKTCVGKCYKSEPDERFPMVFFRSQIRTPKRRVYSVDCAAILGGSESEVGRARKFTNRTILGSKAVLETDYIQLTKNCHSFLSLRDYIKVPVAPEEEDLPIAFSILLYKEVEQAERLLHAIYRPHNLYCLHVDMFSDQKVHDAVQGIADCFSNVFVVSRQEYMVYAGFTRLQADLNCMQDLLQRGKTWKYFINLPSQQFPIKTNLEMVKILQIYNGANDIEGITGKRRLEHRFKTRFIYISENVRNKPKIFKTKEKKDNPPYNITVVKGSAYGIFSREFVDFVINNNTARSILDWFRDVYSPDEHYWATLNHNNHLGTPGAFYKGQPDKKPWHAVYANWGEYKCFGRFVHGVCVFGVGDLPRMSKRKEFFVNKFYLDFQPLALDCIEEWYLNRTGDSTLHDLNMTYYKSLPFIRKLGTNR